MFSFLAPLHPPLVAFPLVLIVITLFCELAFLVSAQIIFKQVAKGSLVAALVFAILAYITGHQASEVASRSFVVPDEVIGHHFLIAKISLIVLVPTVALKFISDSAKYSAALFLWLYRMFLIFTCALFIYTGWLGGQLVFKYGAGVFAPIDLVAE